MMRIRVDTNTQTITNTVVVIGFPMGASLMATERINSTVNVCPQILQGVLERSVSVYATSMELTAIGNYDTN